MQRDSGRHLGLFQNTAEKVDQVNIVAGMIETGAGNEVNAELFFKPGVDVQDGVLFVEQ